MTALRYRAASFGLLNRVTKAGKWFDRFSNWFRRSRSLGFESISSSVLTTRLRKLGSLTRSTKGSGDPAHPRRRQRRPAEGEGDRVERFLHVRLGQRVGFVMSPVCPVYPKQQTFPDPVSPSHLGQGETYRIKSSAAITQVGLLSLFSLRHLPQGLR